MMRMAYRDGEGIGGAGAGAFDAGEEAGDHCLDLRFVCIAYADHGFFDCARGIFADGDAVARRAEQHHAARLAQL